MDNAKEDDGRRKKKKNYGVQIKADPIAIEQLGCLSADLFQLSSLFKIEFLLIPVVCRIHTRLRTV